MVADSTFEIHDSTRAEYREFATHNQFSLFDGEELILDWPHPKPPDYRLEFEFDMFEDVDFYVFLWIHNIIDSAERRALFMEHWKRATPGEAPPST